MDVQQQIAALQEQLAEALEDCNWEDVDSIERELSEICDSIGADKY